ncbi:MAG: hypothetical protein K0R29_1469 [Pseudobdellovibrio sp.]|jgi:hypothetical protein|nr:hypothetical protein [Pseudobdellovibrio sp.]
MSKSQRRQFLKDAAKSLGLLGLTPALANVVVQALASQAKAQVLQGSNKRYIFFCFPGAPPRWFFDLPLTPNGATDTFSHAALGTYVGTDAGIAKVQYKTWQDPVSRYHLPPVWGSNPAGGAFTNCLANALFVRGLDLEINNHVLGRLRNQSPIIGGLSIAGVLAQKTANPFPAASLGSITAAFKSEAPISPVELNMTVSATANPINTLMSYFAGKAPVENLATEDLQNKINQYADSNEFSKPQLLESKARADDLIKKGVANFTQQWPDIFAKYQALVSSAMSRTNTDKFMANAVLKPPPPSGTPLVNDVRLRFSDVDSVNPDIADLRNMINPATTVPNLAATFAAVEILITSGLTQVITTDISGLAGLNKNLAGTKFNLNNDQHFVGTLVSTIATTYLYRAVLSCTEELIKVFKAKGDWDDTVIQFGSEFSRTARADGAGSDHGFKGGAALVLSGMISRTTVVGNIENDLTPTYLGYWGLAATHPLTDHEYPIRINDVAKTVCGMLGVRNVANNGVYLLKNNGSSWEAFPNGEAKNVKKT